MIIYQHDEDGNLVRDDKWTYQWNAENRLIAMESQSGASRQRLEFRYDPQGRRIQKAVYELQSGKKKGRNNAKWELIKKHHYIYDGWNMVDLAEISMWDALFNGLSKIYGALQWPTER